MINTKLRMSFRRLILGLVMIVIIAIMLSVFYIFNHLYMNVLKQKYREDTLVSSQIVLSLFEEEKENLRKKGQLLVYDELLYNAIVNDVDMLNSNIYIDKNLSIVKPVNKINLLRMVNRFVSTVSGSGNDSENLVVSLYNDQSNMLVKSNNIRNFYIETGKEDYFLDFRDSSLKGLESIGDLCVSSSYFVGSRDFYLKGITLLNYNIFRKPKATHSLLPGFGILTTKIDSEYLAKLKKNINKEVMLYSVSENAVTNSTLYDSNNKPIQLNNIDKIEPYKEFKINNKFYGFSFQPIYGFKNKLIGYVGVGSDLSLLTTLQKQSTYQFVLLALLLTTLTLGIMYISLNFLYQSFDKLLAGIDKVKTNLNYKLGTNSYTEFIKIADSINTLSQSVQEREQSLTTANQQLQNLNETLEDKVEARTLELNKVQEQLIKTEKVATLGVIAGGIAHTINSPLTGVLTTLQLMDIDIESIEEPILRESFKESISMAKEGIKKSADSIKELMSHVEKHKAEFDISTEADYSIYNEEHAMTNLVEYTITTKSNRNKKETSFLNHDTID